jgi:hypothetical protein
MSDKPISTRPLDENEKLLRQKFYESVAAQSDLMDKLSERLLTLELAIPGAYAAVLKLLYGEKATIMPGTVGIIAFVLWFASLILTLFALWPKKWKVDTTVLKQDPAKISEGLGIEDFFEKSAFRKRWLISLSSVFFFAEIVSAILTL